MCAGSPRGGTEAAGFVCAEYMCSNDKMHERYVGIFSHTPPCIEEQHNSVANSSEREAMASMQAASLIALSFCRFQGIDFTLFPDISAQYSLFPFTYLIVVRRWTHLVARVGDRVGLGRADKWRWHGQMSCSALLFAHVREGARI